MKKILLGIIALAGTAPAFAQVQLDDVIRMRLEPNSIYRQSLSRAVALEEGTAVRPLSSSPEAVEQLIPVAITIGPDASVAALEAAGLEVQLEEGDYVFGMVAASAVEAVAATEGVEAVELMPVAKLLNDRGRAATHVDDVHAGADLPSSFTGRGVFVGLMDSGLDPNHVNFLTADGTESRVRRMWKYTSSGSETVYTTPEKIAAFTTDDSYETHGTHVLGTMAGAFDTGVNNKRLYGVATDADILICCGYTTSNNVLKGVKRMCDYAASAGRPIAINLSLGVNNGPHDGSDAFTKSLSTYATDPNVTICISAGNEGDTKCALITKFPETNPVVRTLIAPNYNLDYVADANGIRCLQANDEVEIWGEDNTPFDVKVALVDVNTGSILAESDVTTSSNKTTLSSAAGFKDYYYQGTMTAVKGVSSQNNRYRASISLNSVVSRTSTGYSRYYLALIVTGKEGQRVDFYSTYQSFIAKGLEGFTESDGNGTINSWAAGKDIISVGALTTYNYKFTVWEPGNIGDPIGFSSFGELPDGTLAPMILAPGSVITSSMSSYYMPYSSSVERYHSQSVNGKTYYWMPMQGTSMASPHMAGIVALWLEADPSLTTPDIIKIAQLTAQPVETPSMQAGGGIVDAYAGLKYVLNHLGVTDVKADESKLMVRSLGGNRFEVTLGTDAIVELYNMQGLKMLSATTTDGEAIVDASSLPQGVYVLTAADSASRHAKKIVVR